MATKANHHYIPQFYLRSFADGVGRQARVFTFDSEEKRSFTTQVRNVGSKRHFNRVNFMGVDPNAVEDSLAKAEDQFAPHLEEVVQARSFPSDDHFASMMNLLSMISVRNPRMRNLMADFHRNIAERIMSISLSSRDIWESQIKEMRKAGVPLKADITYEDMLRFHKSKEYDIVIDQTYLIGVEMKMIDPVLKCSARRNWSFISASRGSQYITSDDPVVLTWTDKDDNSPYSPGHGLGGTTLSFPLSPDLILAGTFELIPQKLVQTAAQVAETNSRTARYATKQIYARNGNFLIHLSDRENVRGNELERYYPK